MSMDGNLAYKLESYPDKCWEELIGGKVVMMAPARINHNRVAYNISIIFHHYLRGKRCEYFPDGNGLYLSDQEHYIPDGMVVCDPDKVRDKGIVGAPDLVVEVLSRGTARNDRGHKKDVYETYGVREYWIVDPLRLSVEQYVLEGGKFFLREVWQKYPPSVLADMPEEERASIAESFPCAIFDGLTVRLDDVFDRIVII